MCIYVNSSNTIHTDHFIYLWSELFKHVYDCKAKKGANKYMNTTRVIYRNMCVIVFFFFLLLIFSTTAICMYYI